jgi:hypothetical protein
MNQKLTNLLNYAELVVDDIFAPESTIDEMLEGDIFLSELCRQIKLELRKEPLQDRQELMNVIYRVQKLVYRIKQTDGEFQN